MENKINILFVVGGLHRAGAERFAYELDYSLDKNKFSVSILCLENKNDIPKAFGERYYENKHANLGTPIKFINELLPQQNKLIKILNKIKYKIGIKFKDQTIDKSLNAYLEKFDVIHWIGEYTFIHSISDKVWNKSLIHIMSAKFQDINLYKEFNFDKKYNFCSPFYDNELKYELSEFKSYNRIFIPLVINVNKEENPWRYEENKVLKIGIFTRLNKYKPLDPFFYSFQLLKDRMNNVELHVFGAGDPIREGVIDILDRIGIKESVYFRGHQEDIVQTALNEKLSLSWFQGYNNSRPAGYAGIDICTSGVPLLCWDFFPTPNTIKSEIYPHYKNLNSFVDKSIEILTNSDKAMELSNLQFSETIKERNITKYLEVIEQEYFRISNLSNE